MSRLYVPAPDRTTTWASVADRALFGVQHRLCGDEEVGECRRVGALLIVRDTEPREKVEDRRVSSSDVVADNSLLDFVGFTQGQLSAEPLVGKSQVRLALPY